jgi:CubicO group peptidase (beta-lactamase class C family)
MPPPTFVAIHDRTHANYQQQWNSLVPQGYRPISVSVYGARSNPRYAAVWVKRAGPEFVGIHGADASGFQSFFDTWAAKSFSPTILSVAGSATNPVFACIMEKSSTGVSLTRFGLTRGDWKTDAGSIDYWLDQARKQQWIPRWIATYGSAAKRRYAIVLDPNPARQSWGLAALDTEDGAQYQQRFEAQRQQWARPALVTVSPDRRYLALFRDDVIGPWEARHGLTSAAYQTEFDAQVAKGFFPLYVQAGGSGGSTRFAALFARQEAPEPRTFTVTGPAVPTMAAVDTKVTAFMKDTSTRAASVAVVRDGRLVVARSYTWAEAGYPITQPTSTFRIASCTKPITSVAIHQLFERLSPMAVTDTMQPILGLAPPGGGAPVQGWSSITIEHLLTHTGGWDRSEVYDLPYAIDVANAYGVATLPVSKQQIAGYMAGQALRFMPGDEQEYSNLGFLLLGLIVEQRTGRSYANYVRDEIFKPLGLTRPHVTRAAMTAQPAGAVRQHGGALEVVPSVIGGGVSGSRPLLPLGYGGEDYAIFDSFGGWAMAAVDYAKFVGAFTIGAGNPLLTAASTTAMWTVPALYASAADVELPAYVRGWNSGNEAGGVRRFDHGGGMPGVNTLVAVRSDGWGYAVFCNGDNGVPDIAPELRALSPADWPAHDLFPEFGISAFPRIPSISLGRQPASSATSRRGSRVVRPPELREADPKPQPPRPTARVRLPRSGATPPARSPRRTSSR